MTRPLLLLALVSAVALAAVGSAEASPAQTTRCDGRTYKLIFAVFPGVVDLRATNLPVLTDGYAPRCLVAERIAGNIQSSVDEHQQQPARVHPGGARWNGGVWTVSYRFQKTRDGGYMRMSARRGRQLVTANLIS